MAVYLQLLLTLIRMTDKHENEEKLGHAMFGTTRANQNPNLLPFLSLLISLSRRFLGEKGREIKHSHTHSRDGN